MGAAPALTRMRHELIRAELARSGGVRIRDLVDSLGVSRATVRRDLHALVDAGEAVNARGGALLPAGRAHGVTALEHEAIARAAADTITAADTATAGRVNCVGLFGGPLIHALARRLTDRGDLRIVTNSLAVAGILTAPGARVGPQTTLLSGTLSPAGAMVGNLAYDALAALRLDACYFDCVGFDSVCGATVDDLGEADLRRLSIQISDRAVLLVERAALGKRALGTFAAPAQLHAVIDTATGRRGGSRTPAGPQRPGPQRGRAALSSASSR
jgi:DeoR/GlpR family transcriptional regulator of sugar metabolism